jgi:hypothetical protein
MAVQQAQEEKLELDTGMSRFMARVGRRRMSYSLKALIF